MQITKDILEARLRQILIDLVAQLNESKIPELHVKSRSKNNLLKIEEKSVWTLGEKTVLKTCKTSGGSKELLKLVNVIGHILRQIRTSKTCTIRQLFYESLNWVYDAQFNDVNESNNMLDSLETLTGCFRENFGIRAEQDGHINGYIEVISKTRSGQRVTNCLTDVHEAGFPLPPKITDLKIKSCEARFALVIESGGMYQRLIEDDFHVDHKCLLIHTKGQSSRATRFFIKKLMDEFNIPVFIFTDGDVWGASIAESIRVGSIKSCHLSEHMCSPKAVHIGLFPSQIKTHKLPTDKLTPLEKQRIDDMLVDPRYSENPVLYSELKLMRETGLKAEQQAFAKYGTDYVSKNYLPQIIYSYLNRA